MATEHAEGIDIAHDDSGRESRCPGQGGQQGGISDASPAAVTDDLGGGSEDDPQVEFHVLSHPAFEAEGRPKGILFRADELSGQAEGFAVVRLDIGVGLKVLAVELCLGDRKASS